MLTSVERVAEIHPERVITSSRVEIIGRLLIPLVHARKLRLPRLDRHGVKYFPAAITRDFDNRSIENQWQLLCEIYPKPPPKTIQILNYNIIDRVVLILHRDE